MASQKTIENLTMASEKTIENTYQSKDSQRNRILNNPEAYIGSTEKKSKTMWIHNGEKMVKRKVSYVPGLLKIFEEILLNVWDQRQKDQSVANVIVRIDVEKNLIRVRNKGAGIPVVQHTEEGVYVPEMLFGQLNTSSNFGDNVTKTVVGRNGDGAKLTNLFSTEFTIQIWDGVNKLYYKQMFENNMGSRSKPSIVPWDKKKRRSFTQVTFKPDLQRFGRMARLEDDMFDVLCTRVYGFAASLGKDVQVKLNGKHIKNKFSDYVEMFSDHSIPKMMSTESQLGDWEVCVTEAEGRFEQISFVNSVATKHGGTHVDHVTNAVANHIVNILRRDHHGHDTTTTDDVKKQLWVFVKAVVDNPEFKSEKKDELTSSVSKPKLSRFLKNENNVDFISGVIAKFLPRQSKETNTKKLETLAPADAEAKAPKKTLILTEGESAKSVVMAMISGKRYSVKDAEFYDVYALRGKLMNVRNADPRDIKKNKVIQDLKATIGLEDKKSYDGTEDSLRYKHIMLMTDPDNDGAHIKGLFINFLHFFWPSLLKIKPPFLSEFITPLVTATRKPKAKNFYSMREFNEWHKLQTKEQLTKWTIRYNKGLATSRPKEIRKYFSQHGHKTKFVWDEDEEDGGVLTKSGSEKSIERAFGKKKIEDRRELMRKSFKRDILLPGPKAKTKTFTEFMENDLILFSLEDLRRSIPSVIDGFKLVQRKVFHSLRMWSLNEPIKVSDVSALVSMYLVYHHGDQCLSATIIKMAQGFPGTNNLPLLQALSHFGTRDGGGKYVGQPRYLETKLSRESFFVFPEKDDALLSHNKPNEKGKRVEPNMYVPIIPMILVNGCLGIGSGWSTYIPKHKTTDIISNIEHLLKGEDLDDMIPWNQGFEKKGKLKGATSNMYLFDRYGQLKRYANTKEILLEFYSHRLETYSLRKKHMDVELKSELERLDEQVKIVAEVVKGRFKMENMSDDVLLKKLKESVKSSTEGYDLLLDIKTRTYTREKLRELKAERQKVDEKIQENENIDIKAVYAEELEALKEEVLKREDKASRSAVEETSSSTGEAAAKTAESSKERRKTRTRDESGEHEDGVPLDKKIKASNSQKSE